MASADPRLDDALARWRAHPHPTLAVLVVRAGALAGRGRDAITGTDPAELQAAWLAADAARDPADLDRLLRALTAGRCAGATIRLERLATRPADPRILEALVAILEIDPAQRGAALPFTSDANRPFWRAFLAVLEARADASVTARLAAVRARPPATAFQRWLAGKLGAIAEVTGARAVPPLPPAAMAAAARLEAELTAAEAAHQPAAVTADALFAAVWAEPDADAPRAVLADFLAERGDPRGELIALQLARHAGTLDAAGKRREKELLKRHKKTWLGPIGVLIQPYELRFERGFLVTCQLEPNAELERTLVDHPAWSTIREYRVHGYSRVVGAHVALAATLARHGAVEITGLRFTRGIA